MNSYNEIQELELNRDLHPLLYQDKHTRSEQYRVVSTIEPLEVLRDFGWVPREYIAVKSRVEGKKGFQVHRVRLFNENMPLVRGSFVELLLTNSYDGSKAFQLALGVFRMVCSNGLVVGNTYQSASVKHVGYTGDKIALAIDSIVPQADKISGSVDKWGKIGLSEEEQEIFAESALELRKGTDSNGESKFEYDTKSAVRGILATRRSGDRESDLWTTYNKCQESLVNTGIRAYANNRETGRVSRRKIRGIGSIDKSDVVNKGLWLLAEKMAELKNGGITVSN